MTFCPAGLPESLPRLPDNALPDRGAGFRPGVVDTTVSADPASSPGSGDGSIGPGTCDQGGF
jgi:hypothetical protein